MPEWFITGKKGAGKSLCAVGRIRDYLKQNRRAATNLDLRLNRLVGPWSKKCNAIRLPDKPLLSDLLAMGVGNPTINYRQEVSANGDIYYELLESPNFNEDKNGIIVLDEMGTWMNTRDFQDKARKPILDWLVHARKYGWDILYIMQDLCQIDKQARESYAEHVVYTKRLDRVGLPFIGFIASLFGFRIPMPRVHLGVVLYGTSKQSPVVDRWIYRGNDLFAGYNTLQKFSDRYPHRVFSYLPPYLTHGRFKMRRTLGAFMRLTKIVLRKFSRPVSFVAGLLVFPLVSFGLVSLSSGGTPVVVQQLVAPVVDLSFLEGYYISGRSVFPGGSPVYFLQHDDKKPITTVDLINRGLNVEFVGSGKIIIKSGDRTHEIYSI